jgi:hypothetical protein
VSNKLPLLALVAAGALALVVWMTLRAGTAQHPIVAGPERPTQAACAGSSNLDTPTGSTSIETDAAASDAKLEALQPAARKMTRPTSIVLYGYVRMADGLPPPDEPPYAAVTDAHGTRVGAKCSVEGAYSISGLLPGHYRLHASARQPAAEAEVQLDLALAESPKRQDITVAEKPSLLVKVIGRDGQPVSKAWLGAAATREPPGEWVDETPAMNHYGVGRFGHNGVSGKVMETKCLGQLDLDIPPPLFVSLLHNQRIIATQRVESGQREVEFVVDGDSPLLETGKVRVHFVDQAGKDVTKIWATVDGGASTRQMKVDAGVLTATGLAPGWYRIRPYAQGLEQLELPLRLEPGEDKDFGDVTLEPEAWISGTIVGPNKTSERMGLRCDPFEPGVDNVRRYSSVNEYAVQPDRTFRIGGRSRRLYLMKYSDRDSPYGIWARLVDLRSGPIENLQVVLVPGVPVLVHSSSDDWHAVTYTISDEAGVPYEMSQLWGTDPRRILLAPGRYQVDARRGSEEPTHKTITVAADPVDLALP